MCSVLRIVPIGLVLFLLTLPTGQARGQAIFFQPCWNGIPLFQPGTIQLWVCVEGQIQTGITSAQFRIDGLPESWLATGDAKAPYTLIGDLFGNGGIISTNGCAQGVLWLQVGSIQVVPTTMDEVMLSARSLEPALPAPLDCPLVTLCDEPAFTKVCCGGFGAWINGGGCPVAVESSTWSEVKGLYH